MESISDQEKHYIIVQLILTGISPIVVREIFDREFHPVCLKSSLSKVWDKIQQLKNKGVMNQSQMNLLYPKGGIEPSSSTFDITLMLCLLRNFTEVNVYDQTPQPHDTSLAADLGRLHYYRNECAHLNLGEFSTEHFNLIWSDLTEALKRLGGSQVYEKCQKVRQDIENSDQRIFYEIFNEMHSSMKERENFKEEFEKLKEENKLKIDFLRVEQQEEAELGNLYRSKEDFQQNIEIKRQWRENLNRKHFILSKAAISIYQTIQQNQFVAVFGMCGSGKSTLAQYTALRMSESHAYLVISVIASGEFPWEFPSHHCLGKPLKKILFVLDDWFGKFSISDFDHMRLSSMLNEVKHFSARHNNFRFLFTCRPEVIALNKLKDVLPSIVECNLQSPELSLSLNERQKIFDLYIHDEFSVNQDNDFLLLTEQLPLLCTLYRKHFCSSIQDFILNSDEMMTSKIEEMRESENPSYICLALLLVAGELDTQFCFSEYAYHEGTYDTLQSVISESSFKKKPTASRKLLLSGFDAIEGIYTNREGYLLSFTNDKIYDVVVSCIGSKFIHSIVKFAKYSFIENRVRLQSFTTKKTDKSCSPSIILNHAYYEIFFARLLQEIRHRNERVFANIHNNNQGYRKAFIEYLKVHLTESDIDSLKLPLFLSCKLGYDDFVLYLVGQWTRLLDYSMYETPLCKDYSMYSMYQTETPLSEACSMGYFDIVKLLVDSQKNIHVKRIEPIELACKNGHLHIVKFLLTKGVYRDLTNTLIDSCEKGFTDIVLLLIQKEPNLLKQFQLHSGASNVLITACTNGHEEVVRILLGRNLPVNNPEFHTPLYYASMKGHLNIVKLLLNSKAQVNKCDISVAEWNDHEEIVTCLRNHLSLKNE